MRMRGASCFIAFDWHHGGPMRTLSVATAKRNEKKYKTKKGDISKEL
jgi:hypothetical protein